jgi:molybdopterin converting factor subunit 1
MIIEVLFFGQARDIAGARSLRMEVPEDTSVMTLRKLLAERFSGLDEGLQFAVAVNEVYAENRKAIQAGDVVAVLPPVSGG